MPSDERGGGDVLAIGFGLIFEAMSSGGAQPPMFVQQIQQAYEQVVAAIIRPPRTNYEPYHLGPPRFEFLGRTFVRIDFVVFNSRGHSLACSRWQAEVSPSRMLPTLIFMHGNACSLASRVEEIFAHYVK